MGKLILYDHMVLDNAEWRNTIYAADGILVDMTIMF